MSRKKKTLIIAISVLVPVLAVGGALAGWGASRWCGGITPDFILARIDDRVEDLNLNKAQKRQYQELRARFKAQLEQGFAGRRALMSRLQAELNKPTPDMAAAAGLIKQRLNRLPARFGAGIDIWVDFYNILTPEQQQRVLKKMRRRMAWHRGFWGGK